MRLGKIGCARCLAAPVGQSKPVASGAVCRGEKIVMSPYGWVKPVCIVPIHAGACRGGSIRTSPASREAEPRKQQEGREMERDRSREESDLCWNYSLPI